MSVYRTIPSDLVMRVLNVDSEWAGYTTQPRNGPREAQVTGDSARLRYEVQLVDGYASDTRYKQWSCFLDQIRHWRDPFYIVEPFSDFHPVVHSGTGNGTLTTWPVRVLAPGSAGVPLVADVAGSTGTLYSAANLLGTVVGGDAVAECSDVTYWPALSGGSYGASTRAIETLISNAGISCIKVTPTGSVANCGSQITADPTGAPVTTGVSYTGVVSLRASTASQQAYLYLVWWGGFPLGELSTSASSLTTISTTGWTQISVTAAAPVLATTATLRIVRTTTTANPFWFDCAAINPGDYAHWQLPSLSSGLYRFASAPAANSSVKFRGLTGRRLTLVALEKGSVAMRAKPGGRREIASFRCEEVW